MCIGLNSLKGIWKTLSEILWWVWTWSTSRLYCRLSKLTVRARNVQRLHNLSLFSLGAGEAAWLGESASPPRRVVIGAISDFIVDVEGVAETARFLGTKEILLEGVYHDIMLGREANDTAGVILERLAST